MVDRELLKDLERLGRDLDGGTESLAVERKITPGVLLRDLVPRVLASPPEIVAGRERRWGVVDLVVVLVVLGGVLLVARAGLLLARHEPAPADSPLEATLLETLAARPVEAPDLAGRTLLALPVTPASYSLLGELPTRLSAALVLEEAPESPLPRPLHRFDDLLALRAEAADDGVAVLFAVPDEDLSALLQALPGTAVHLLRGNAPERPRPTDPPEGAGPAATP